MKGLFLRIIAAFALLLWAIDMVFPWQKIMQSEQNPYTTIKNRGSLIVGTINNPIYYFIGNEGESGLEYELAKNFADYLGVRLQIKTLENNDQLFNELENNNIDIAAANLLFQPQRAEKFQLGPSYTSASWQLVYKKGENRPKDLAQVQQEIIISAGEDLEKLLSLAQKKLPALKWQNNKQLTQEELLIQVAEGKIPYTIANSIDVAAAQQIRPNLAIAFDLTDEMTVHWYLSNKSYNELQAGLLDFMNNAIETGLIDRIEEKYFRHITAFALLLWAVDMVFPWQKIMQSEQNPYTAIKNRGSLIVGTINNPIYYFIGNEGESGLEYELAKNFADYLGVRLQIKTLENNDQLFNELENNNIDIAAANLLFQPQRAEKFQLGPSYTSASWQLVYKKGENRPKDLAQVQQEIIISAGEDLEKLLSLAQKKLPALKWQNNKQLTQEELLIQVAEGKIPYTIANSIDVAAAQQIRPNLAIAFDLTDEMTVHWYLSNKSYNELQAGLLDFMNNAIETGLIDRIEEKYFRHITAFDYVDTQAYLEAVEKILPQYQPLFEKYKGNLDWRLLAAVAYQESHWDPYATSPTGVRGMMMLTKDTAVRMNINNRTDAEQSIKAGSEYLHWLLDQMPDSIPEEDRIWYSLAAYNMGLGHILDARRLTKKLGGNPDNWLDVKNNLQLLSEKRHYSNLKYGYARGYEAYQYVENIRRYMNSIVNYHRVQENQATTTK